MRCFSLFLLITLIVHPLRGAEATLRTVPPPGIQIDPAARTELEQGARRLAAEISVLRKDLRDKATLSDLLSDVEIFHKAVEWAVLHDEFYRTNEISIAHDLLRQGFARAEQLRRGSPSWLSATGLVVRGYVSQVDGSVQPYGLVVPASYRADRPRKSRLDVWLHGRDNNLTELKFISGRMKSLGEFTPPDTLVLHPYGRYCNAFKFAGEVDVFEALEHVRRHYQVDENRLAIRGFSMGGAGCWHLAAHHAGIWAAAAPGAGFAETLEYTGILVRNPALPSYERTLFHLYDAADYALNLANCPTIAYSGEIDKQKQSADVMAAAMATAGLKLEHVIGPKTGHKYEPNAKEELSRRFDQLMQAGRDPWPSRVRFTTWTLRYNKMLWVTLEGMEQHWHRAEIDARLTPVNAIEVTTTNLTAFTLKLPPALTQRGDRKPVAATIDGQTVESPRSSGRTAVSFQKRQGKWVENADVEKGRLRKRPGLQGPIDDAFMERFLMVRPTGSPISPALGAWVAAELAHATNEWRAQFRGALEVKDDVAVREDDISRCHLVLWGDPQSNKLLGRIAGRLPMQWTSDEIRLGKEAYPTKSHVPVMIYPNPLNPDRYVVVNSGFTFCEAGHLSNALQTPKLPDYAILRLDVPITRRGSNGVAAAGFFDEGWQLPSGL